MKDFQESNRDNIKCESCDARLKYTKGHWRNNNKTWVASFFSLYPNIFHTEKCKYNIEKAIDILVSESTNLESVDLNTLFRSGNNLDFRIHVLAELITTETKDINATTLLIRQKSLKKLSSYLKTAKGIAKLWNSIQESDDKELLKEKIHLVFNKNRISWNNFIFETEDFNRLVSIKPRYPVALIFQTKKFNPTNKDRTLQNCIQCYAGKKGDTPIVLRIYYNENIFQEKKQYLIIGYVKIAEMKENSKFINISGFIYNKSQVTLMNEEEVHTPNNV